MFMALVSRYCSCQQSRTETLEFYYADKSRKDAFLGVTKLGLLFLFGVALNIWASLSASAAVPKPILKIDIFPPQLSLQVGETGAVGVKIVNESDQPIKVADLKPTAPKGITVNINPFDPPLPQTLLPKGEMLTRYTVTASKEEPPKDSVYFVVTYGWPSAKERQSTGRAKEQGTAFQGIQELKLTAREPSDMSKIATLELSTAALNLNELHSGIIYLTVKNISNRPIHLDCPEIMHPNSIEKVEVILPSKTGNPKNSQTSAAMGNKKKPPMCNKETPLRPGENQIFELSIKTMENASAGQYPLVIILKLYWQDGAQRILGTLTTSQTVELGVFGESVILNAFAIPSFLVLPGFLIMGIWLGCRRLLTAGTTEMPVRDFWIVAISLSIVAAKVYPYLTGILTGILTDHKRDYLQGYGLIDLVYVWTGSILFGLLFALPVFLAWPFLRHKYFEPQLDDNPDVALRKAKRSCASLAPVKKSNDDTNYFVYREKDNLIWLAPKIKCVWNDENQDNLAAFDEELKTAKDKLKYTCLCRLLNNSCYAGTLSKLVSDNSPRNITVMWEGDDTSKRGPLGPFNRSDVQFLPDLLPPISI
jgi:hypothetical protein